VPAAGGRGQVPLRDRGHGTRRPSSPNFRLSKPPRIRIPCTTPDAEGTPLPSDDGSAIYSSARYSWDVLLDGPYAIALWGYHLGAFALPPLPVLPPPGASVDACTPLSVRSA
jgi:hypothetical protein